MSQKLHSLREKVAQYTDIKDIGSTISTVLLILILVLSSVVVVADIPTKTWSDDFEDESADGWEHAADGWPKVQNENGNTSLYQKTNSSGDRVNWTAGPNLELQDGFTITGTFKGYNEDSITPIRPIRMGVFGPDPDHEATDNALIIFDKNNSSTYLSASEDVETLPSETIQNSFNNTWVNFKIDSPENEDVIRAKVWQTGTLEPAEYQLEQSFDPTSGVFGVDPGNASSTRYAYLDDVKIEGTEETNPDLSIDTRSLLRHGESQSYSVLYEEYDSQLNQNVTQNVTENSTVKSMNTNGITVDQTNNRLIATSNESFADRVYLRAEYNNSTQYQYVTVAKVNMQNLAILPPWFRISATLGDDTIFLLIISILTGIAGTRLSTAFGGISMMEMTIVVGWLAGYVSNGLVIVSVFMAMFIGLNLAANIDYHVAR